MFTRQTIQGLCLALMGMLWLVVGRAMGAELVVAQDGSGQFRTVQQAIDAAPAQSGRPVVIRIRRGTYREKLVVPASKTHLTLRGEDRDHTILTFDDHSGKGAINTYTSYSVLVEGADFTAENLTFQNTAGRTAGQAVALHVAADRCTFRNCRILGDQDTLFLATGHTRQYFRRCFIEGTTDFIFGSSTAVFDHCTIRSKKNSHITAAATPPDQAYGFVFRHCRLTADTTLATNVSLGRPWQPHAHVAYLHTYMGRHIRSSGWDNWKKPESEKTARYAEYRSTGPGATPTQRVAWARQLPAREARRYTLRHLFAGTPTWHPARR
ncbi:pectinesterase family protein [Hymenobacter sp. 5516J-16]|uniref:pectinesterase family protein n=1 Tax=Hymenobacter sp. 5516J-16 TaxID=2932253 RepID=UPI001FD1FBF7|nr:pectinesterase family protein [Hymenobacter sp. 5516J-16]UOQ76228.1 pectinesterase family protein [Hymenobacter sp. 5516J-16]